jgi:hypothetical protein
MNALRGLSAVIARWRLRRIVKRRVREMLRRGSRWPAAAPAVAAASVLFAAAVGCSATTVRMAATSREPVGCCCTYGDCRERFTQEECASGGEFQGWTYTWHAGACTKSDTYPASDRR